MNRILGVLILLAIVAVEAVSVMQWVLPGSFATEPTTIDAPAAHS